MNYSQYLTKDFDSLKYRGTGYIYIEDSMLHGDLYTVVNVQSVSLFLIFIADGGNTHELLSETVFDEESPLSTKTLFLKLRYFSQNMIHTNFRGYFFFKKQKKSLLSSFYFDYFFLSPQSQSDLGTSVNLRQSGKSPPSMIGTYSKRNW